MRSDEGPEIESPGPYKEGKTKSEVLLYITCHDGSQSKQLRKYIREKLNILTKKPIDNQVDALVAEHIIYKRQMSSGDRGYYTNQLYIHKTFHAFTAAYPILAKYGKIPEFMATPYYADFVSSEAFTSKILLSIFKNGMLQLDQYITDNGIDKVIQTVEASPPAPMAKSKADTTLIATDKQEKLYYDNFLSHLDNLKYNNTRDTFVTNYEQLIQALKNNRIDDLTEILTNRATDTKKRGHDLGTYLEYLSDTLLTPNERTNIGLMCRLSISALNCVINPVYPSASLITNISSWVLGIRVPHSFFKPVCEYDLEVLSTGTELPLYTAIKSEFIHDLRNNQLVKVNDYQKIIWKIFEEKNDEPTTD